MDFDGPNVKYLSEGKREREVEVGDDVFPDGDDAWKVTDEKVEIREAGFAFQLSRSCLVYSPFYLADLWT